MTLHKEGRALAGAYAQGGLHAHDQTHDCVRAAAMRASVACARPGRRGRGRARAAGANWRPASAAAAKHGAPAGLKRRQQVVGGCWRHNTSTSSAQGGGGSLAVVMVVVVGWWCWWW